MPGLRLYPNEGSPGPQFVQDMISGSLTVDHRPQGLAGAPWHDTVTFSLPHFLWLDVSYFWRQFFTSGVTQRRLSSGEVVLYPATYPCQMMRACWDVMDKRTEALFTETATGLVVVSQVEVGRYSESWQLTLHRGDYYLNEQGELEASTKGCGG